MPLIYVYGYYVRRIARDGKSSHSTSTTKSRTLRAKQKKTKSPRANANDRDHHRRSSSSRCDWWKSRNDTTAPRVVRAVGLRARDHDRRPPSTTSHHPPTSHHRWRHRPVVVANRVENIPGEHRVRSARCRRPAAVVGRRRNRSGIEASAPRGNAKNTQSGVESVNGMRRYRHRQAFCKNLLIMQFLITINYSILF